MDMDLEQTIRTQLARVAGCTAEEALRLLPLVTALQSVLHTRMLALQLAGGDARYRLPADYGQSGLPPWQIDEVGA